MRARSVPIESQRVTMRVCVVRARDHGATFAALARQAHDPDPTI